MKYLKWSFGLAVGLITASTFNTLESSQSARNNRFQLRVSLYPWVPEAESLVQWIETDFESKNSGIDLVIRPLEKSYDWKPEYVGDLAYEIDKAVAALTTKGEDSQHLVEVDTMILGALAKRGAVAPFGLANPNFLAAATEAVTWKGKTYGVPHWTCGYFVISEASSIRGADNVNEFLLSLKSANTKRVDLVGDLDGSWDSVMVYLDAFRDTYPFRSLEKALSQTELDSAAVASLRATGTACSKDGKSLCGSDGVDLFATGGADALVGYSERLNPILAHPKRKVSKLYIASATLGGGDKPTLFTDALVMSPSCSNRQCQEAARRFASYYVSDKVFEVVLMSLDVGASATPRYLLPSTKTAFDFGKVRTDQLYKQLKTEIEDAKPYPNSGVPEARERGVIGKKVKEALGVE